MPSYDIALLGGFAVRVDGRPVPASAWRHKRAAELVKILALADGQQLHREQVMELLWPDLDPDAAAANLRKAVHYARAALGAAPAIQRRGDMLELCPAGDARVDAVAFESAAQAGDIAAIEEYRGELLPEDRYAPWAQERRERLRLLYLRLLKAAGLWERVLDADPADEEAHRVLMRRAVESGDRQAAVRQFDRLCEHLRADLGVGPDKQSVAVYEQALAMAGADVTTPRERACALLARALLQLNSGELDEAELIAARARELALDAGLGLETGKACAVLGILANLRGQWRQRFRAEFLAALRQPAGATAYVLDAHLCLAESCLYGPAGYEEFSEYARELLALAKQASSVQGRALAELLLGEAEALSGRLGSAHRLLTSSIALHELAGATSRQVVAMHRLAEVALASGQRTQATSVLKRSLGLAGQCWLEHHVTVRIHETLVAASTNPLAACRLVEEADRALDGRVVCQPCSMGFHVAAAIAWARGGHVDQGRRRLQDAERVAGMWSVGTWHPAIWEARGALRQAEGDTGRAAELYSEAADQFAELGRPLDRHRCQVAATRARHTPPGNALGTSAS